MIRKPPITYVWENPPEVTQDIALRKAIHARFNESIMIGFASKLRDTADFMGLPYDLVASVIGEGQEGGDWNPKMIQY